jgi:hypothetical protein
VRIGEGLFDRGMSYQSCTFLPDYTGGMAGDEQQLMVVGSQEGQKSNARIINYKDEVV